MASASFKARTTLYSLILAFAVFETIFGLLSSFMDGFSPLLWVFGKVSGSVATAIWIWTSILLSFNNRPLSTHALTRSSVHYTSFIVFAIVSLALGIMLATQIPIECNFETPSDGLAGYWCSMISTATALVFLVSALSAATAILIYRTTRKIDGGLAVNIAHSDKAEWRNVTELT